MTLQEVFSKGACGQADSDDHRERGGLCSTPDYAQICAKKGQQYTKQLSVTISAVGLN